MNVLRQLGRILVAEDYRQFGLLFVCALLAALMQVTGVASIFPFMQLVAQPGIVETNEWMGRFYALGGFSSEREMLIWSGMVVFTLFVSSVCLTALTDWLIQRSIWNTAHRLCVRQLKVYMQLPYEFFTMNNSTELLRRIVADVNNLLTDVLLAGSQLLAQVTVAAALFALLLFVHPQLSAIAFFGFGTIYIALHWLRHAYLVRLGKRRIETDQRRYSTFMEAITGIKAIRVANASRFFVDRFSIASVEYSHIYPRLTVASNLPRYAMEILAFGGILAAVMYFVALENDLASAIPLLSLFALATYRLMPALHTIFESAARLSNSVAVIESVSRDMRKDGLLEPELIESPLALTFEREIRLSAVSFEYEGASDPTIDYIDLRIKKGESVAIVGTTGSGKTTLVDIVVGLLMPSAGALQVDGVPVGPDNVANWRQLIAYVPQDVFFYDESVANNISFGRSRTPNDDDWLKESCRMAQMHDFVTSELPDGYDTLIGERGVRLSGGQRQRLGIARGIYRRPQILLLDEATSALDSVTEESVISRLRDRLAGVTLVMIAHRLSTVRFCDRIILMEAGKIQAAGSYDDLYRTNARFRQMVDTARGDS